MMAALAGLVPAMVIGWLAVRLLAPAGRGWAGWVFELSLGTGVGIGVTSALYFAMLWLGVWGPAPQLIVETLLAAAGAWFLFRRGRGRPGSGEERPFAWIWALRAAAAIAAIVFGMGLVESAAANPMGEWDAFSIWNVKAKYLAGGPATWRNAIAPVASGQLFGASHPGYPLLVPGAVAREWTLLGDTSSEAPALLSLVFTAAAAGLLFGAVAIFAGEAAGLLALLVLLATEGFASQAASQYADIPLALFIMAAVALAMRASEKDWEFQTLLLAGLCAGLAAWTKNEGLPFLLAALAVTAWRGGGRAGAWVAAGAGAPAILLAAFKTLLVKGSESMFPATLGEAFAKIGDPSRWMQIAASFARSVWLMGVPWAHPVLLVAVAAFCFGWAKREEARKRLWLALPVALLLAADFAVYLVTTAGLTWHLGTSNNRLIVQVWPAVLLVAFLTIAPPVTPPQAAEDKRLSKAERKRNRRGASRNQPAD